MAMPRKGSRRTSIGDHTYLWRCQKTEPIRRRFGQPAGLSFLLIVQRDKKGCAKPGSVAFFHLECRSQGWFQMSSWYGGDGDKPGTNLSNDDVRELVGFALDQGWDPEDTRGPAFWVWADEEQAPDLDGFNLSAVA
jgi:hypothetical protein